MFYEDKYNNIIESMHMKIFNIAVCINKFVRPYVRYLYGVQCEIKHTQMQPDSTY